MRLTSRISPAVYHPFPPRMSGSAAHGICQPCRKRGPQRWKRSWSDFRGENAGVANIRKYTEVKTPVLVFLWKVKIHIFFCELLKTVIYLWDIFFFPLTEEFWEEMGFVPNKFASLVLFACTTPKNWSRILFLWQAAYVCWAQRRCAVGDSE